MDIDHHLRWRIPLIAHAGCRPIRTLIEIADGNAPEGREIAGPSHLTVEVERMLDGREDKRASSAAVGR
jgi:hypothetical protein